MPRRCSASPPEIGFSLLQLADGRLTVYDLQALGRAPTTLVLSACESGLSSVSPGQ
jgi:hypothetical protein